VYNTIKAQHRAFFASLKVCSPIYYNSYIFLCSETSQVRSL